MLKEARVSNFQSHHLTSITFHKNVNVIFGLSDSGKSGFVRAFKALNYRNSFYITNGQDEGDIEYIFDDATLSRKYAVSTTKKCPNCKTKLDEDISVCICGEIIKRKPSSDVYTFDGTEMKAFGVNMPDEITSKIKLVPIKFVDITENLNLFEQHDDLFFVAKGYDSKRSKLISTLVPDSDKIDNLVKKLNSESLSKSQELQYLENKNEVLIVQTSNIKDDFEKAKILNETLEDDQSALEDTIEDIDVITRNNNEIKKCNQVVKYKNKIVAATKAFKSVKSAVTKLEQIVGTYEQVLTISNNLKKLNITPIELEKHVIDLSDIEKLQKDIEEITTLQSRITTVDFTIKETTSSITKLRTSIQTTKEELKEFLKDDAICPITNEKYCESCQEILCDE